MQDLELRPSGNQAFIIVALLDPLVSAQMAVDLGDSGAAVKLQPLADPLPAVPLGPLPMPAHLSQAYSHPLLSLNLQRTIDQPVSILNDTYD